MAWSTHFPGQRFPRRWQQEQLLAGLARLALFLLIGGALWLDIDLLWSLRRQEYAPPPVLPEAPPAVAAAIVHRHLFGEASAPPEKIAAPAEFRLLGVLAGRNPEQGAAILLANGEKRPLIAHVGQTVAPGLRLTAVAARQATLERNGTPFTLELPGPLAARREAPASAPHKPVFD